MCASACAGACACIAPSPTRHVNRRTRPPLAPSVVVASEGGQAKAIADGPVGASAVAPAAEAPAAAAQTASAQASAAMRALLRSTQAWLLLLALLCCMSSLSLMFNNFGACGRLLLPRRPGWAPAGPLLFWMGPRVRAGKPW